MTTTLRNLFSNSAFAGIAALTTVSLLASATPAFAGSEPGYSHDGASLAPMPIWMTLLPSSMKLSYMSIPGTHDSMSVFGGDAVQTQSMDLESQLVAGIRVLDIRILFDFNEFDLCHGVVPQPGNFDSVLQTISGFLAEFPGETVLMRLQDATDTHTSTISFEQAFKNYQAKYPGLFWNNTSKETNPTLGEIRGKVVILQDFTATGSYGLPYSSFNSQDDYNFSSNWYLYTKWTEVKNQLGTASLPDQLCPMPSMCVPVLPGNDQRLYINYLSGSGGSFPYFVASGKSDPSTGAPLLLTGMTTITNPNSDPDFPRVGCFLGMCSIAFEGTNNLTYNWLNQVSPKRVGIIMADFPGWGLITKTIALNNAAKNGL